MSLPAVLTPSLNTREAVADAAYRCVLGLDLNDVALFNSALAEECRMEANGRVLDSREVIHTVVFERISKLDTTHFITNTRINIEEGDRAATMTAAILTQHYRGGMGREPDATRYMTGGQHLMDLIYDDTDGLWKITVWRMKSTWGEGERAIVL